MELPLPFGTGRRWPRCAGDLDGKARPDLSDPPCEARRRAPRAGASCKRERRGPKSPPLCFAMPLNRLRISEAGTSACLVESHGAERGWTWSLESGVRHRLYGARGRRGMYAVSTAQGMARASSSGQRSRLAATTGGSDEPIDSRCPAGGVPGAHCLCRRRRSLGAGCPEQPLPIGGIAGRHLRVRPLLLAQPFANAPSCIVLDIGCRR